MTIPHSRDYICVSIVVAQSVHCGSAAAVSDIYQSNHWLVHVHL